MPASSKRIRQHWKVKPTAEDEGLKLTLTVVAYDNGRVEVDGVLVDEAPTPDPDTGWLAVTETVTSTLVEFRQEAAERRKEKRKKKGDGGTRQGQRQQPVRRASQPPRPRPEPPHPPYDSSSS